MKTNRRTRSLVTFALAAGLALTVGAVVTTDSTTAGYVDRASVMTSPEDSAALRTEATSFGPVNGRLANTAMAIQADGTLWIWGYRGGGLSGSGVAAVSSAAVPTSVVLPNDGYTLPGGQRRVVKAAGLSLDNFYPTDANYTGIAALSDDGLVYTWGGNNTNNAMGRPGVAADFYRPGVVSISVQDGPVVDLVSSSGVFMALTSNGTVYTWGNAQSRGITGQGSDTASSATPTAIMRDVHSIGAGMWNGWAIRGNYSESDQGAGVFWWGWSMDGASYGDPSGDNVNTISAVPKRSTSLSKLAIQGCDSVGIVAGSAKDKCSIQSMTGHYYGFQFVTDQGQLHAWGAGPYWGTGRPSGTAAQNNVPTLIPLPGDARVKKVGTTEDYVILLSADERVFIYGRYAFGRGPLPSTGAVSTVNLVTPTEITALGTGIKSVAGFGYSGMALKANGHLVMWGGSDGGANNNPQYSIRNGWRANTAAVDTVQPLTDFQMPGVG